MARLRNGTENPMMVMPPEYRAAAPAPAIARPMMNIGELVAAAQIMLPTSKMTSAPRYVYLTSKYVYTLPIEGCKEVVVSKYEEPYQPTSSRLLKTEVILGMAVAMIVLSRAMTKVVRQRPKESVHNLTPDRYLDSSSGSSSSVGPPAMSVVVLPFSVTTLSA